MNFRRMFASALLLVLIAGCGGAPEVEPTGKLTGKVTVAGKPLSSGFVNLVSPQGVGTKVALDANGVYTLGDGLPVGEYKAFISFDISPAQFGTPAADVLKTVPEKYQGAATSGLVVFVHDGENTQDLELK
jgi:hypothetical protein